MLDRGQADLGSARTSSVWVPWRHCMVLLRLRLCLRDWMGWDSTDDRYMRVSLSLSVYVVGCLNVNMRDGERRRQYRTRDDACPSCPHSASSSWSSNPCCHASTCSLSSSKVPGYSILVPGSQGNPCPRVPKCSCLCCAICIPTFHHAFSIFARNIGLIMYLSHLPYMARKGFVPIALKTFLPVSHCAMLPPKATGTAHDTQHLQA